MSIALVFTSLIKLLLVILGVVGFLGTVIGIPLGIILSVVKKNKDAQKWMLWLVIGGPVLLLITFVFWALTAFINVFFGISVL